MKINLSKVKKVETGRTLNYDFSEKIDSLKVRGEKVVFVEPVDVHVSLTYTGRIFHVTGYIDTTVRRSCSRCLGEFEEKVKLDFEENFIPSYEAKKGRYQDLDTEELTVVTGEQLDLTEKVLQNILLDMPMRVVCKTNCKGICPQCGTDLNEEKCDCKKEDIDPRLEVLGKLLKTE